MGLTAVSATQFSSVQLADTLNAYFETYLVPATQSVVGFVQCFSVKRTSLVNSRVWLAEDEPAAIATVARRGSIAHPVVLVLRSIQRGKGLGRELMQDLLMLLQQQGVETVFLEVVRGNHAVVAPYQTLGLTQHYGLCGYLSSEPLTPAVGVLQLYPILVLLRHVIDESSGQLPWLLDPLTFATLPCQVVTLEQRASVVPTTADSRPAPQFLWVELVVRHQGSTHELPVTLAQQLPDVGISAAVPETFTLLSAAARYAPLSLQQYEMSVTMNAPWPVGC